MSFNMVAGGLAERAEEAKVFAETKRGTERAVERRKGRWELGTGNEKKKGNTNR